MGAFQRRLSSPPHNTHLHVLGSSAQTGTDSTTWWWPARTHGWPGPPCCPQQPPRCLPPLGAATLAPIRLILMIKVTLKQSTSQSLPLDQSSFQASGHLDHGFCGPGEEEGQEGHRPQSKRFPQSWRGSHPCPWGRDTHQPCGWDSKAKTRVPRNIIHRSKHQPPMSHPGWFNHFFKTMQIENKVILTSSVAERPWLLVADNRRKTANREERKHD